MNNIPLGTFSIQVYVGEKRGGKTLTMVAETFEQLESNPSTIVYSNFYLNKKYFPTYQPIEKSDIENYYKDKKVMENSIFLIDEGHIFFDSRQFMQKGNIKISYFFGQMGKRGNVLRTTTHYPELLDYRVRQYCERWIYIQKGLLFSNNEWKPIFNNNRVLNKEENKMLVIKGTPVIRKMLNYQFYNIPEDILWVKAKKYFDMYDTHELIFVSDEKKKEN